MPDNRLPLPAFHFRVDIAGGGRDTAFREVEGLEAKAEVETVVEGGENRFVHRLPKAVTHPNLVVKRGLAPTSSPLVDWCRDVLEGGFAKPITRRSIDVHLLDEEGEPVSSWSLADAFPVAWQAEPFGALKNEVAIERIEFAYTVLSRTK